MSNPSGVPSVRTPEPSGAAERRAAASRVGADGARGSPESRALADRGLADRALADPGLADPGLADPGLADPGLADPGLADRALADRALADRALADRALADRALADLAEVFALLGEPGRLRLLVALLARDEVCVHDLALAADLSDSSASHALRLLRAHRVVAVRRVARLAYYRLADDHVRQLLETGLAHAGHTQAMHPERLPRGRWR